jgi:hypothetical protein
MSRLFFLLLCAEGGHRVQRRIRKATPFYAPSRSSVVIGNDTSGRPLGTNCPENGVSETTVGIEV